MFLLYHSLSGKTRENFELSGIHCQELCGTFEHLYNVDKVLLALIIAFQKIIDFRAYEKNADTDIQPQHQYHNRS